MSTKKAKGDGLVQYACAVINVGSTCAPVSCALATCCNGGFHTVYIVDQVNGQEYYDKLPEVKQCTEKGISVQVSPIIDGDLDVLYGCMTNDIMFVTVPPDFWTDRDTVHRLVKHAKTKKNVPNGPRRFAFAPAYTAPCTIWTPFLLILHMFMCAVSWSYRNRYYRDTYMVATLIDQRISKAWRGNELKETVVVDVPSEEAGHRDKDPYMCAVKAQVITPDKESGVETLFNAVYRERFSMWVWIVLVLYLYVLMYNPLPLIFNPVAEIGRLTKHHNGLIALWIIHALITLYYWVRDFNVEYSYLFIPFLPMLMPLFFLFVVIAKIFWRGGRSRRYRKRPKFEFPEFTPFGDDGGGANQNKTTSPKSVPLTKSKSSSSSSSQQPQSTSEGEKSRDDRDDTENK